MTAAGEHSHIDHVFLEAHKEACKTVEHEYGSEYVHKHVAECLENDSNAVIYDIAEEDDGLFALKMWWMFAFFAVCYVGLAPKACAGVFLGMALLHMMPDGVELYNLWTVKAGYEASHDAFPLPYVAFVGGYLIVLLVDKVISQMFAPCRVAQMNDVKEDAETGNANLEETKRPEDPSDVNIQDKKDDDVAETPQADAEKAPVGSKATAIILVLALSFHSLFEGIAFGLQSTVSSANQLGVGLIAHKPAAVIALGASFARTGYSWKEIIAFITLFAVMQPIGQIVGMLAAKTSLLVDTIFVCLSGGTFIYIACTEIIVQEFGQSKYRWAKMLLVILGGMAIGSMWFFPHSHGHEGQDDHGAHSGHDDHDHRLL